MAIFVAESEADMQGQLTIWDFIQRPAIKQPAEEVAEKMNACLGTKFEKVMDDGYYLLFVYENKHRFVIDGTNKGLGFGIDGNFFAYTGYEDIKARYLRCMNN